MPRIDDMEGSWTNPYDQDHYDPMNHENPNNSLYYIADQVHRLEMFMNNDNLEISEEQIIECIDNLSHLAQVLKSKEKTNQR